MWAAPSPRLVKKPLVENLFLLHPARQHAADNAAQDRRDQEQPELSERHAASEERAAEAARWVY